MTSMTVNGTIPRVNGALRVTGPLMPLPRLEAVSPPPAAYPPPEAGTRASLSAAVVSALRGATGDMVITWAMAATVAVVAVDAAIVSYSHIYGLATGQPGSGAETGIQARLLPLSIDGVIVEASLVKLYLARHKVTGRTKLATFMLWLGITATVAANVVHGLPSSLLSHVAHVFIMALLSAWPAGALIGSVEMAMRLVRATRDVADTEPDSTEDNPADNLTDKRRDKPADTTADSAPDNAADNAAGSRRTSRAQKPAPPADPVTTMIRRRPRWDDDRIAAECNVHPRTVKRRRAVIEAAKNATADPA